MKETESGRKVCFAALFLFVIASVLFAQDQKKDQYQPEVGQEGKDVVWVPTPQELVNKMLDMAKLTSDDYLIDLGSGDGRTVITAAKKGATALGIEYNPDMVQLSKNNAAKEGVSDKATFVKADLFETDLSKATVITMFLLPEINMKLRPKILSLKPGTRIVSNTFTMEDWEADDTVHIEGGNSSWRTALLWIVPAKVSGTWNFPKGSLTLDQKFQIISGTLKTDGKIMQIEDGKMRGDHISFNAGGMLYTGNVKGNTIEGTCTSSASTVKWTAARAAGKSSKAKM
jgi:precorrin-6B methylase 2